MAVQGDFGTVRYEDGVLTLSLTPPVAIGGWSIQWTLQRRFGRMPIPLAVCSVASGMNGVSGITVTNSGQGVMTIQIPGSISSGLEFGNYASEVRRTDSGFNTSLAQGYWQVGAGNG